jgi:hypothetical protein
MVLHFDNHEPERLDPQPNFRDAFRRVRARRVPILRPCRDGNVHSANLSNMRIGKGYDAGSLSWRCLSKAAMERYRSCQALKVPLSRFDPRPCRRDGKKELVKN